MNLRGLACVGVVAIGAVFALVACGGELPSSVEDVRDVPEETLSDFNGQFRSICASRGLGRFTGGLSDEVCDCVLRVIREQVADDDLVLGDDRGIDLPKAVEERSLDECVGEDEP